MNNLLITFHVKQTGREQGKGNRELNSRWRGLRAAMLNMCTLKGALTLDCR